MLFISVLKFLFSALQNYFKFFCTVTRYTLVTAIKTLRTKLCKSFFVCLFNYKCYNYNYFL